MAAPALLGEMPATASLVRSPRDQLVIDGMLPERPKAAPTISHGRAPTADFTKPDRIDVDRQRLNLRAS
jgi:hypothetical protein